MNKNEKNFSTRDIGLAATLVSLGFPITTVDMQIEGARGNCVGYFAFEKTPELLRVEKEYWSGTTLCEPRGFLVNLRSLKSRITNLYKNPSLQ